jgi:large subunit ribosomal protein L13
MPAAAHESPGKSASSAGSPWDCERTHGTGSTAAAMPTGHPAATTSGRGGLPSVGIPDQALDAKTQFPCGVSVRTFSPKAGDVQRQWHVVDASDVVLGRLASHVASLLRGKHKPIYAPHVDTGDFVIVVNARNVAISGNKLEHKRAYRHSGYPGGLRSVTYRDLLERHPERVVEKAVRGMLPKNSLGRKMFSKLKVYAGPEHPHQAQQPEPYQITQLTQ